MYKYKIYHHLINVKMYLIRMIINLTIYLLCNNNLIDRIIKQHTLTKAEWDDKVLAWYKEHKGLSKSADHNK